MILKVPGGLIKKANDNKKLSDVVFWYQLKSINQQGFFKDKHIYSTIISNLGFTKAKVQQKLSSLLKNKYIHRNFNGYNLISYDTLWLNLGYDLSEHNERKGNFKIFKINIIDLNNLKEHIFYEEIKFNLKKQQYIVKKEFYKKSKQFTTQKNHSGIKLKIGDDKSFDMLLSYVTSKQGCEPYKINNSFDISLSCKGISDMFGYQSAMSGFQIEKRLKNMGLLKIKKRLFLVSQDPISYNTYSILKKHDANYIYKKDLLYYNNTNKIYTN